MDYLYELILINDGSSDNTIEIIRKLAGSDNNITYISFSRNFAKRQQCMLVFVMQMVII